MREPRHQRTRPLPDRNLRRRRRGRRSLRGSGKIQAELPRFLRDPATNEALFGARITGRPPRLAGDIIPGASAVRQSVHGLVIALLNYIHQNPPRVMAEEERIWKRDLEGMAGYYASIALSKLNSKAV